MSGAEQPTAPPSRLPSAPRLRVLLYADDERFTDLEEYATAHLRAAFARGPLAISADTAFRHEGAALTRDLLVRYDEVWFLLWRTTPREALTCTERGELQRWMDDGGGVLLTGDHAEVEGGRLEGRGATVGRCVPRAGEMRLWRRGPGVDAATRADSTEFTSGGPPKGALKLEKDGTPPRLLLVRDVTSGLPHPIFLDGDGTELDLLPDHRHEGQVLGRDTPMEVAWPTGAPLPEIVARGINRRDCRLIDTMSIWDGHRVKSDAGRPYGRILADSSFHHYVDMNLGGIVRRAAKWDLQASAAWQKLAALYCNQAAWLAPHAIRAAHVDRALADVGEQLGVAEGAAQDPTALGRAAYALLAKGLPGAWLHELLHDLREVRGCESHSVEDLATLRMCRLGRHILHRAGA